MRIWMPVLLWVAIAAVACATIVSGGVGLPYTTIPALISDAAGAGGAMCGDTTITVIETKPGPDGGGYRFWLSDTKFVAAHYPADAGLPDYVWLGAIRGDSGSPALVVTRAARFEEIGLEHPCDHLAERSAGGYTPWQRVNNTRPEIVSAAQ